MQFKPGFPLSGKSKVKEEVLKRLKKNVCFVLFIYLKNKNKKKTKNLLAPQMSRQGILHASGSKAKGLVSERSVAICTAELVRSGLWGEDFPEVLRDIAMGASGCEKGGSTLSRQSWESAVLIEDRM